jgi:hypothetical protein
MWGVLHLAGWMSHYWNSQEEYSRLGKNDYARTLGFEFVDLIQSIHSNDSKNDLKDDFASVKENGLAISKSMTSTLLFNGKTAFLYFVIGQFLEEFDEYEVKQLIKLRRSLNYGRIDVKKYLRDGHPACNKNVYLLPNTSSRVDSFDEFVWIDILKKIKYGV